MFRCDARGHGEAAGLWAPEEGRGALSGAWGAQPEVSEVQEGAVVVKGETAGRGEDQGGLEVEQFYEDDLEFQIASF
ncbi:hypothetical protein [Pyxidicoccus xibeiensis]|uniref:hypothetical protein n=1 Tax=Pyxidicoccus xibeiensis TaxID=2906759 RepID=UPI0020A6F05E|nr:hypothetical protein [Pyxidicoccus xibeiensis]MCP3145343.1 hypothetical protein [Pyxidicoccus xibeiensis]